MIDLELASGRMRALRSGPAGGRPVICIPGLSANARSFDRIASRLAASGHDVVVLDLRGRGFSPAGAPGTHGWLHHAEDVLEAAAKLGFPAVDLVGHSMGAYVAMQAAALGRDRLRRLVLIDAIGSPDPAVVPPILAAVQRLGTTYRSAAEYLDLIHKHGTAVPWDELWREHYLYDLEEVAGAVQPRTSKAAVLEDVMYASRQNPKSLWPAVTMPALLVRSSLPLLPKTGFLVPEKLRDEFLDEVPSARAVEVEANHYGVMAHPEALRAIDAFLTC